MAVDTTQLARDLDALLPQTQCRRCGFEGCQPYARAMASGAAKPNRCPPGGESTLTALSAALGRATEPLDPATGTFGPLYAAVINEDICIGCAKCLPACPVDAIVGARRYMHTVITQECSGCELCIAPCPVDCIVMVPVTEQSLSVVELQRRAQHYRRRIDSRSQRIENLLKERELQLKSLGESSL